jgi:hypothetical protein
MDCVIGFLLTRTKTLCVDTYMYSDAMSKHFATQFAPQFLALSAPQKRFPIPKRFTDGGADMDFAVDSVAGGPGCWSFE